MVELWAESTGDELEDVANVDSGPFVHHKHPVWISGGVLNWRDLSHRSLVDVVFKIRLIVVVGLNLGVRVLLGSLDTGVGQSDLLLFLWVLDKLKWVLNVFLVNWFPLVTIDLFIHFFFFLHLYIIWLDGAGAWVWRLHWGRLEALQLAAKLDHALDGLSLES